MSHPGVVKLSLQEILLTSSFSEEWKPAVLSETPESYIHDIARARASLREAERVIQEQAAQIRHLESLALTDELTGLLNRRGFTLALQREMAVARRDSRSGGALVMVDLDDFKTINDMCGHSVGDDYLQAAAHALIGSVRAGDVVARLGGDEFVILFSQIDEMNGKKRLASLERSFNSRMIQCGHHNLPLKASFGLCCYDGNDNPDHILLVADQKLYASKRRRTLSH